MSVFDRAGTLRRLINQYQDSPNIKALFQALIDDPSAEIREALESLYGRLSIDDSSGIQLDRIGYIVGQPRPDSFSPIFIGDDPERTFTFLDGENEPNKGFSGLEDPETGGAFIGLQPSQRMNDADYRVLLKAAIFRNNAGSTIPEIEEYGRQVLGDSPNVINGFTYIDVQFQSPLTAQQRRIIENTLVPAAGIRIRYLSFARGNRPFGFAGRENNTGFGTAFDAPIYGTQEILFADGQQWLSEDGQVLTGLLPQEEGSRPFEGDGFVRLF